MDLKDTLNSLAAEFVGEEHTQTLETLKSMGDYFSEMETKIVDLETELSEARAQTLSVSEKYDSLKTKYVDRFMTGLYDLPAPTEQEIMDDLRVSDLFSERSE